MKVLSPSRLLLAGVMGVALVSAGVSPASAAAVADQTQSGASTGTGFVYFGPLGGPPPSGVGSSFTAGVSGQLTQIDIPVLQVQTIMGTILGVQVSVYSVDSFGVPTGGPLAVQDVPGAGIAALASGGTLSVVFSTPATVAAGTPYAFVVEMLGVSNLDTRISLDTVAAAPDKLAILTANYVASVSTDGIAFTTYVEGTGTPPGGGGGSGGEELADTGFVTSVPLAVAFAMLVAGAALVVSRRTRRQHSTALDG